MDEKRMGTVRLVTILALSGMALGLVWIGMNPVAANAERGGHESTRLVGGYEFPVNENGQTYGDMLDGGISLEEQPDLVSVWVAGSDVMGYVAKEHIEIGPPENPDTAFEPKPEQRYPIYESDGETQIGWWIIEDTDTPGERRTRSEFL